MSSLKFKVLSFHCDSNKKIWHMYGISKAILSYILINICVKISMFSPYILSLINPWYHLSVRRVLERALVQESRYTLYPVLYHHFHIVLRRKKFCFTTFVLKQKKFCFTISMARDSAKLLLWINRPLILFDTQCICSKFYFKWSYIIFMNIEICIRLKSKNLTFLFVQLVVFSLGGWPQ